MSSCHVVGLAAVERLPVPEAVARCNAFYLGLFPSSDADGLGLSVTTSAEITSASQSADRSDSCPTLASTISGDAFTTASQPPSNSLRSSSGVCWKGEAQKRLRAARNSCRLTPASSAALLPPGVPGS